MAQPTRTSTPSSTTAMLMTRSEAGGTDAGIENRFALTGAQRSRYERDGFVVLPDVVPGDVLGDMRRVLADAVDRLAHSWCTEGWIRDACETLPLERRYGALCRQLPAPPPVDWRKLLVSRPVYRLWQRPELLGRVRSLLGDEVFAHGLWNGEPLEPGNPIQAVSWHRDADLHGWQGSDLRVVSLWFPLVPVEERSGCLQFVPGSHRSHYHYRHLRPAGGSGGRTSQLNAHEPMSLVLEPGDAVIFCDRVLHQSLDNLADHVRWSMEIRFCEAAEAAASREAGGYRCHSAAATASVETYETWAARYVDTLDRIDAVDDPVVDGIVGLSGDTELSWRFPKGSATLSPATVSRSSIRVKE